MPQDFKLHADTIRYIQMQTEAPSYQRFRSLCPQVNMFKSDGDVIHFAAPKVQANIAANTYVIAGNAEEKKLTVPSTFSRSRA